MKTSKMMETMRIERYLQGTLSPLARQVFKVRLLANPNLRLQVYLQRKIHQVLKLYHRKKQKAVLEALHQELISDPAKAHFQKKIHQIFG